MKKRKDKIKVLIVTPEITYLPKGMGNFAQNLSAKAGGMADVSASLVAALFERGVDVHVAIPHYRRLFHVEIADLLDKHLDEYNRRLRTKSSGEVRIHLAEDRTFYYLNQVYPSYSQDSMNVSLVFQREVINNIIPQVEPDLIHCNDWMTGLIPGYARRLGIPSLFTVHNIHTMETTLENVENHGIDTGLFWETLFFMRRPENYEESRTNNRIDLLTSGIFGAHFINTVSPTFLKEIVENRHGFVEPQIQREIANKYYAGCAQGILNSPDPDYTPETDKALAVNFTAENQASKKRLNKLAFQKATGLMENENAPLFFWPSRLDPMQKGPELLSDILYSIVHDYWEEGLQVAVVADGPFFEVFRRIVDMHGFQRRVCVCPFQEKLSRLGYAASDYILMPSRFEPCGLPQMIGPIYGSLPIVFNTGGLHDTVQPMNVENHSGNGYLFDFHDSRGLRWAVDQAMGFHRLPLDIRNAEISRVMREAQATFNNDVTANEYVKIYESMLKRPLIMDLP